MRDELQKSGMPPSCVSAGEMAFEIQEQQGRIAELENTLHLSAAAERKACIRDCDEVFMRPFRDNPTNFKRGQRQAAGEIAAAIRKRGEA